MTAARGPRSLTIRIYCKNRSMHLVQIDVCQDCTVNDTNKHKQVVNKEHLHKNAT